MAQMTRVAVNAFFARQIGKSHQPKRQQGQVPDQVDVHAPQYARQDHLPCLWWDQLHGVFVDHQARKSRVHDPVPGAKDIDRLDQAAYRVGHPRPDRQPEHLPKVARAAQKDAHQVQGGSPDQPGDDRAGNRARDPQQAKHPHDPRRWPHHARITLDDDTRSAGLHTVHPWFHHPKLFRHQIGRLAAGAIVCHQRRYCQHEDEERRDPPCLFVVVPEVGQCCRGVDQDAPEKPGERAFFFLCYVFICHFY
jgi:hypothetical protein